jgi:hypothetical protein
MVISNLTRSVSSAALWLTFASPSAIAQPRAAPESRRVISSVSDLTKTSFAIGTAAAYLERSCDARGRFAYSVDTDSGKVSRSYNIVRHAGAIYAFAMLNRFHPHANAANAMLRASEFMRENYISRDARSDAPAVWSRPVPANREAELGAAGLALVALAGVQQAKPGSIPSETLQGIGKFVLFLQRPDGSFYSKYRADTGPVLEWQSLYYPGEAILGLVSLYQSDRSQKWLNAAAKGLGYLVASRKGSQELPPDHWALIATAEFLPYYQQNSCSVSRSDIVQHAMRICNRFLKEQITKSSDDRLIGGFDPAGRTTPTAIRLEGLLAALEFLPPGETALRGRIKEAVDRGIDFLLRAQITSGPYAGGMPESALKPKSVVFRADPQAYKVRIDYVQHSLCAWLRYENMFGKK